MNKSRKPSKEAQTLSASVFGLWDKMLKSKYFPGSILAIVLSSTLVTFALLLAFVAINGSGTTVSGLRAFAGWSNFSFTRSNFTPSTGWYETTGWGGTTTTSSSSCPLLATNPEIPSGQWQGCYFRHNGAGSEYFNTSNFVYARKDNQVNFDWQSGSPSALVPQDNFSGLWKGKFNFEAGEYTFTVVKDDGMRVGIDGQNVFDRFYSEQEKNFTFKKTMTAGYHELKVEYFELTGLATAKVTWVKTSSSTGGGGGGGGTPLPSVNPYAMFTSDGLNDGSGNGYGVVSVCSLSDTGRYHPYNVESNVPVGVRLTEGSYTGIGSGSYIASKETPDSDGKYRLSFRIDGNLMPNDTAIKFGLFSVLDAREIGTERGATSRHDDCANYSINISLINLCPGNLPPGVVVPAVLPSISANVSYAETGKSGHVVFTGNGINQKYLLTEHVPGFYGYSLEIPSAPGDYKIELYFNGYLRDTKTFQRPACAVSGSISVGDLTPAICSGDPNKDITISATANRIGYVKDVLNNTVVTLTDPDGNGTYTGQGVVSVGPGGKTLNLTLLDGAALTPVGADQVTISPICPSATFQVGPSSPAICEGRTADITLQVVGPTHVGTITKNGVYFASFTQGQNFTTTDQMSSGGQATYQVAFQLPNGPYLDSSLTRSVTARPGINCALPMSGNLVSSLTNSVVCPGKQVSIDFSATGNRPGFINIGAGLSPIFLDNVSYQNYSVNKTVTLSPGYYTVQLMLQDSPSSPAVAADMLNISISNDCADITGITDVYVSANEYGLGTGVSYLTAINKISAGNEVLEFHADGQVYDLAPGQTYSVFAVVSIGAPKEYTIKTKAGDVVESFTLTAYPY